MTGTMVLWTSGGWASALDAWRPLAQHWHWPRMLSCVFDALGWRPLLTCKVT